MSRTYIYFSTLKSIVVTIYTEENNSEPTHTFKTHILCLV